MKVNRSFSVFGTLAAVLAVYFTLPNSEDLPKDHWVFKVPRTVPDLISSSGYKLEEHSVTTEDGYILTLHRIRSMNNREPILLGQCLSGSSAMWLSGPQNDSLAYKLIQEGFDVWMMNIRGNHYSRNHTYLNPEAAAFWQFSFDESARFDFPATIDYVLNTTGYEQIQFVGYSMGTTQYLIFLSELPEYNRKIKAGYLLGPTASFENTQVYFKTVSIKPVEVFSFLLKLTGIHELFSKYYARIVFEGCTQTENTLKFCLSTSMYPTNDKKQDFSRFINQPGGASMQTILHYVQLAYGDGIFRKFDFGPDLNLMKYGQVAPPAYNLSKVTAHTKLYAGQGDVISTITDVRLLHNTLPNSKLVVIQDPTWNHADFLYHDKVNENVLEPLMNELMRT